MTWREAMPVTVARQSQPSKAAMQVMSPHQRAYTFEAPAVKSRLIRSALAATAGSGTGGLPPPLRCLALQASLAHQPGDPLAGVPPALRAQPRVDPRDAVTSPELLVHRLDLDGQPGTFPLPARRPG
jgi:hypothetical protein